MPYSWKAIAYGALAAVITLVILQYFIKMLNFDVSQLVVGGIAGMVGAYVLGQIHTKDKK